MTIFLLIFFLLLIAYGFLIDYYRRTWNGIPHFRAGALDGEVRASVIIAVRNEENNIFQLLDALARQDYPANLYEVIIVNDHSEDSTLEILQASRIPGLSLHIIDLPEAVSSKKKAIAAGIENSAGELIITTDADCTMSSSWISTIVSFYQSTGAKFIAAPVNMIPEKSLKDIFQSLDFLTLQGITGASVHKHFHTMCNGANLSYPKTAFQEVNGFENIDAIPSGDDMLLMYKIFSRYPDRTFYLKSPEAIVTTGAEKTWKEFWNQRIRWASKAIHYKDKRIFYVLMGVYAVNAGFVILGIASFFNLNWFAFFILFLIAKILIEFPFVNAVAIFFRCSYLMKYFPLMQPLHIVYTIITGWMGRFGSYSWKSRTVKNKP